MNPCAKLSLGELPSGHPDAESRRRLVHADGRSGPVVHGEKIGFQFSGQGYTLLATSYDYFDGCQHWIYLLDAAGKVLDRVDMPEVFGFVQDIQSTGPDSLSFGCFGTNDRWHLSVCARGFWSYSRASLAPRLNRYLLSKRYLMLEVTRGRPWVLNQPANPATPDDE